MPLNLLYALNTRSIDVVIASPSRSFGIFRVPVERNYELNGNTGGNKMNCTKRLFLTSCSLIITFNLVISCFSPCVSIILLGKYGIVEFILPCCKTEIVVVSCFFVDTSVSNLLIVP